MIEIVLLLVILALTALIGWFDYNNRKERKSLYNLIKSRDASELAQLEVADKTKIEIKPPKPPDLVSTDQITDDEFKANIEKELKEE